jgi:hypothetical protein
MHPRIEACISLMSYNWTAHAPSLRSPPATGESWDGGVVTCEQHGYYK